MTAPLPSLLPLLVPDMPSPQQLLPWLERIHTAGQYSNFGPLTRELEQRIAAQFAAHAADGHTPGVTTAANATLALELALQALELPPGARVLVPMLTFVATATAVLRAGHVPVLADVDAHSWQLTPAIARAAIAHTPIDAVLPVATFGLPQHMPGWQQFERDTGLPVVVDAAAAYGGQWLESDSGSGAAAQGTLVFSLHATKSLPAGEGALVVSTRPGLAAKVRQLSNFGINLSPARSTPVGSLASVGSNAKMSEYHAAVALCSLQNWELRAQYRRALQADLMQKINTASGHAVRWQQPGPAGAAAAPMMLCLRMPSAASRQTLERLCAQQGIGTRRWYQPLLSQMDVLAARCVALRAPEAQRLGKELIGLPFYLGMDAAVQQRLADVVAQALA